MMMRGENDYCFYLIIDKHRLDQCDFLLLCRDKMC